MDRSSGLLRCRCGCAWCGGAGNREHRQHARSALDVVADLHRYLRIRTEQDVAAGTKLNEADALAACEAVSDLAVEDDAASDQAGNLLEDHDLTALALNSTDTLLVQIRRI